MSRSLCVLLDSGLDGKSINEIPCWIIISKATFCVEGKVPISISAGKTSELVKPPFLFRPSNASRREVMKDVKWFNAPIAHV